MSHLRPARRVSARGGRDWEIYVYRVELPPLSVVGFGDSAPATEFGIGGPLLWLAIELPLLVLGAVIGFLEFAARLPVAISRAARSDIAFVEAIDFSSVPPEGFVWTVERASAGDVVDAVARSLESAERPNPVGAFLRQTRP